MTDKSLDPEIMGRFTGSEHWYRHGLVPNITFADGAKYVADAAGAYWLPLRRSAKRKPGFARSAIHGPTRQPRTGV
jgi:hypothetical protein